jgi:hypothetical protein
MNARPSAFLAAVTRPTAPDVPSPHSSGRLTGGCRSSQDLGAAAARAGGSAWAADQVDASAARPEGRDGVTVGQGGPAASSRARLGWRGAVAVNRSCGALRDWGTASVVQPLESLTQLHHQGPTPTFQGEHIVGGQAAVMGQTRSTRQALILLAKVTSPILEARPTQGSADDADPRPEPEKVWQPAP